MFVAQRELKIVDRHDKVTILKPGDEVTNFETWDANAQRAHLNLEWVVKVDAAPKKPASPSPHKQEKKKPVEAPVQEPQKIEQPAPAPDQCSLCGKQFKSPKALKTHTTLAHK